MEQLLSAIRGFGVGRLAAMLGVGAGVAAALFAITMNLGGEPKALLYANLDLKEAAEVSQALDQAGVKYELKGDGSTIMVDRDKVASTRLLVSGKGLVTSGSVGYEIFDASNSLGQTDFVQQLNRQRALEGELARTIRALDGVTFARVHLVLPKRQLFEEEAEQPSASVTIGVGGRKPSSDQVSAVQNLVAGAVPNLKAERVTIVDQHGKTLSAGGEAMGGKAADDRKGEVEERIRASVKDLVEGVVGPGKARVTVTADLDLNRVTESQETYDPDGQVIRSEQTTEENAEENEPGGSDAVSAAANIPGGMDDKGDLNSSTSGRVESTTNYEISKTVRTEVREPGTVRKISVAVAVDGITPVGADGKPGQYAPRPAEEMQRLEQLVRAAVGFDATRGDVVSVVNVRFPREAAETAGTEAGNPLFDFDKNDIMRAVELVVLAVIALLVLLFGVRPLMRNLGAGAGGLPMLVSAGGGMQPATRLVTTSDGQVMQIAADPLGDALALPGPDMEQRIDIARIEGQVKASSVKRVSEFVEKHPDESVSILRTWLHETA